MAATRNPIRKLREVLRLRLDGGLSTRAIARSCRLSVSTISGYLGRIAVAKVAWPLPPALDDDAALTRLLFPSEGQPVAGRPDPDWATVHRVHAALVDGPAVDGTAVRDTPATHPPLGRFARSEEIAACVVYLLSDASAFVTGASYVLDGGLTAG